MWLCSTSKVPSSICYLSPAVVTRLLSDSAYSLSMTLFGVPTENVWQIPLSRLDTTDILLTSLLQLIVLYSHTTSTGHAWKCTGHSCQGRGDLTMYLHIPLIPLSLMILYYPSSAAEYLH